MTLREVEALLAVLPEAIRTLQESVEACAGHERRRDALLDEIRGLKASRQTTKEQQAAEYAVREQEQADRLAALKQAGEEETAHLVAKQESMAEFAAQQMERTRLEATQIIDTAKADCEDWRKKSVEAQRTFAREQAEREQQIRTATEHLARLRTELHALKERFAGVS